MIEFKVGTATFNELDARRREFKRAERSIKDRNTLMRSLKKQQIDRWERNFDSEGGEYQDWPELSEAQVNRRGDSNPILIISGATRSHFSSQNRQGRAGATAINWTFSNREGAYTVSHHTGYPLGNAWVPSRLLWDIDGEDEDRMEEQIEDWLEATLGFLG